MPGFRRPTKLRSGGLELICAAIASGTYTCAWVPCSVPSKPAGVTPRIVCENLSRMAQVYRKLEVIGVRAVATSAVRDSSNQHEFIEKASSALGTPVEII